MPFTISHAAAVLPLHRWSKTRLPLAALMIGSMAPDFAYFMPGDPGRLATHSVAGLFWYCLPASLALWLLFVWVLEQPTIALLPQSWRSRFARSTCQLTLRNLALVCAAVILGAATHIVWDSFTHRVTPVTQAFPVLRSVVLETDGYRLRVFGLLQHLSSLFGLVILAIWTRRLPDRASNESLPAISPATRTGAVFLIAAAAVTFAFANYALHPGIPLERRLFHLAIGGMTGGALAWLAIALAISWKLRTAAGKQRQTSATEPSSRA